MIPLRFLVLSAALTAVVIPVKAEYYAETGRTENREVPPSQVSSLAPGQGSAAATTAPLAAVSLSDLYDPDLEAALKKSGIDRLAVQSEGVNVSLRTFAEVHVNAVTGQTRLKMADGRRMDPLYAVLGMIYQNKAWVHAPLIPIEHAGLAGRMGAPAKSRVSPVWVMKTPSARNLVMPFLMGGGEGAPALPDDEKKALRKFSSRVATFLNLPTEFKLVPLMGEVSGEWLAPTHLERPSEIRDQALKAKIMGLDRSAPAYASALALDKALRRAFDERKPEEVAPAAAALLQAVDGTDEYMSSSVRRLDYWNTIVHPFQQAARLSMLAFFGFLVYLMTVRRRTPGGEGDGGHGAPAPQGDGARQGVIITEGEQPAQATAFAPGLALAGAGGGTLPFAASLALSDPVLPEGRVLRRPGSDSDSGSYGDPTLEAQKEVPTGSRLAWGFAFSLLTASALTMVAALVVRFFISGRMPVSNMYESLTFAMASFAVVSVVFEAIYRRGWVGVGAALAGWALMTAANSLPMHMRKVEPLVAVLKSVWLNFHVTSLLISYAAFLLAFVCGVLFFIKDFTGNRPGVLPRKEMFEHLSYRSIQIGWPLLTLGIFLGAVWANTAWGSYWSWDPKETWALITWFAYTIYLHLRMILGWSNRKAVVANMVGFAMVLITYFGVNYLDTLSGGLHSYAEPISK